MFRLLVAISQLSDKDRQRVIRAITQYSDALQHWKLGSEVYALALLYMGVEAITPTAIRWAIAQRGLKNRRALEAAVLVPRNVPLKLRIAEWLYKLAGGHIPSERLETWARREVIFGGDDDTFKTAKAASDKLEHGLSHHDEVRELAVKCVEPCAAYLRNAIIQFVSLSDSDRIALGDKRYAKPAGTGGFERHVLGAIVCDDQEIAAPDQAYPYVRWEVDLKDFEATDDGGNKMRLSQTIKPVVAANAKLRLEKVRFAQGAQTRHEEVEGAIERTPDAPAASIDLLIDDPGMRDWIQQVGKFILNSNALRHLGWYWTERLEITAGTVDQNMPLSLRRTVDQIAICISRMASPNNCEKHAMPPGARLFN